MTLAVIPLLIVLFAPHTAISQEIPATVITGSVTAYSEIDSCHYEGCPMASGEKAFVGAVACPYDIPLGTLVEIDGVEYVCHDRTARFIQREHPNTFDIFTGYGQEAHKKAISHGRQAKEVKVFHTPELE